MCVLSALQHSVVWIDCGVFIHSTVDVCLDGFQFGAVTDSAAHRHSSACVLVNRRIHFYLVNFYLVYIW